MVFLAFIVFFSVTSDSSKPRGLQHARLSCPSPSPEVAQTYVHWVSDAIQPSHPLSPPSCPALNLSQNQGLFQWVGSWKQVCQSIGASAWASVLPMNIQGWFPLELAGIKPCSLLSKGLRHKRSQFDLSYFQSQPELSAWPWKGLSNYLS